MKKNLFIYLLTVLCAVNLFTACSDDDDKTKFPIDTELTGNYRGKLDVKITQGGQEIPGGSVDPQFITVSKAGETAVNLAITDFSFMGIKIGDIKLENCQLNELAGAYSFVGTTNVEAEALTAAVNATGAFTGNKLTITMDIEAALKAGNIKQTVKVTYEGTKLSGNEKGEAQILSFIFDKNVAAVDSLVIVQPTINEENKTITFMVADTTKEDYLKALVPTIEISEGATISPASGVAVDFSNSKVVTYTVTAENGTKTEYKVSVAGRGIIFDFEDWVAGVEGQEPEMTFYEPIGWSSSNTGAHFLKAFQLTNQYVVMSTDDAHSGDSAALIKSIDTKGKDMFFAKAPKVTTGTLFLGAFKTEISNTLLSTKFGIPYANKPLSLKGWYKYTPGQDYYIVEKEPYKDNCHNATLDNSKTDQFMISLVIYETSNYDKDWKDCLTGVDIYTSDRIAAIKQISDGEQKEWTSFELKLEDSDWKLAYDENKLYRLAIICSSSKDGDKFWGAPESTLIVDDFELTVE